MSEGVWESSRGKQMQIDILTLFPGMFEDPMNASMMWKARDRGLLDLRLHDIRDYSTDKHNTVDDTPYGGGGGMVLKPDVVVHAVEDIRGANTDIPVILMSPQGRVFSHPIPLQLAQYAHLILLF